MIQSLNVNVPVNKMTDSRPVKHVTRADFVSKYVGWTTQQTKALLKANPNSILLVDEAYSIRDAAANNSAFDKECLSAIEDFQKEHPDQNTTVIFSDDIKK
jgi:hypothetical protein